MMNKLRNRKFPAKIPVFPQNRRDCLKDSKLGVFIAPKRDRIGTKLQLFDSFVSDSLLKEEGDSERKKMFFAPIAGIHYREAKLTQGQDWFIYFYVQDPATDKLKRIRIKVNRESDLRLRKKKALQIMSGINQRLAVGWNPLLETAAPRAAVPLFSCLEAFLKIKRKEMEATSSHCYLSYINVFKKFLQESGFTDTTYVGSFSREHALAFMSKVEAKLSPKTYNNYVAFFRGLFIWMQERGYVDANPFDGIAKKPKRMLKKNRRLLTDDELSRLIGYLSQNNIEYLAISLLCYGCLIRPKELALLKCGDIDLEKQVIHISAAIAKNDNDSFRTIPDEIMPVMHRLDLSHKEYYLFGDHKMWDFSPGKNLVCSRKIAKYWELVLRKELGFGIDLKFYSLKDTGITNMLTSGVPINLVQKQADHSSVAMTAIYVGKKAEANNALKAADILKNKSSK